MKTKHILFTIALFFAVAFVKAQDKYEFAVIEYNQYFGRKLSVSVDGVKFMTEQIELPKEERDKSNLNPFLKKVKEYQDQNWEVMNFNSVFAGLSGNINDLVQFAYLRRKIK